MATPTELTDKILYAYCDNNPVMRSDSDGKFWNIIIGLGAGLVVGTVSSILSQAIAGQEINLAAVAISSVSGAITGAFAATGIGLSGQVIVNAIVDGVGSVLSTVVTSDENTDIMDYFLSGLEGAAFGAVSGMLGGAGTGTKHMTSSFKQLLKTGNIRYWYSQIKTEAIRSGKKAIKGIVKGTMPGIIKGILKNMNSKVYA